MIDPKYIDLMNLVIDGAASPAEKAELDAHLAASPESRAHFESLSRLVRRLDNQPLTEPPAALEPRIFEAVERASTHASQAPSPGGISSWFKGFFAIPRLRPWSTFGLGLAAGVFLFAAVQFGRSGAWDVARDFDPSHVSGTMITPAHEAAGSIPVTAPGGVVSGSAVVYATDGGVRVDVRLQSTVAVEWSLEYDSQQWSLVGIERAGSATAAFAANPGSIRGLHTGEGGLTVALSGSGDPLQAVVLKVFEKGEPVFEGTPEPAR